jgi:hypothetical protein
MGMMHVFRIPAKGEGSGSFLKKRTKKLLLTWTLLVSPPGAQFAKVFWLLFFKKVTASLLP